MGDTMNNYRVDVVNEDRVPVGMNSIRYVGDSFNAARKAFHETEPGYNEWGVADDTYFVVLSKWDSVIGGYRVMNRRYVEAVHYRETQAEKRARLHTSGDFEEGALCGNGSYHAKLTRVVRDVTCPMCNAKLRLDHGGQ